MTNDESNSVDPMTGKSAQAMERWPGSDWQRALGRDMDQWKPLGAALAELSQRAGGPPVALPEDRQELMVPLAGGLTIREAFLMAASVCGYDAALAGGQLALTKSPVATDWVAAIGRRQPIRFDDIRGDLILPQSSPSIPPAGAARKPWVWYAPSQGLAMCNAWIMKQLLDRGIAIAMVGVGESWGNSEGRKIYQRFYERLVADHAMAGKAVLWPQSRGGLMLYNWAAEHPQAVRAVGGIYTVCNLAAWAQNRQPATAEAYGLSVAEFAARLPQNNPIDRLQTLADAGIPLFHIHGDNDVVVPLEDHARPLVNRYRSLGGSAELLIIPGKGHQAVKEYFQCRPLADFLAAQAQASTRH